MTSLLHGPERASAGADNARRFTIDRRIGVGSVVNLVVLAICVVAFFVRVDERLAALEAGFTEFKGDVKSTLLRFENKLDRKLDRPDHSLSD